MEKRSTRVVRVGSIDIGGGHSVAVQSMANTDTKDVEQTVSQIKRLECAGCEIVRVAVYDSECADAIKDIKDKIRIPLVGDIHFDYRLAIQSIENGVDKVRINPGNIGDTDRVKAVVECAKVHGVPLRIGSNAGSLHKDTVKKHGRTAEGMMADVAAQIRLLEEMGFYDMVISLKSSDVNMTLKACTLFAQTYDYPQHIGITEAGSGRAGIIKSAIGIGSLLQRGIGDTFRVSLTGDPVEEVYAAWDILRALGLRQRGIEIISCPTCARTEVGVEAMAREIAERYQDVVTPLKVAVMGCVVNGPGEASEADVGIAGGRDYSLIFKKGEILRKVENDSAISALLKEIDQILDAEKKSGEQGQQITNPSA